MNLLQSTAISLHSFFASELGRVGGSLLVVLFCVSSWRLWQRYLNLKHDTHSPDVKRERLVWAKNALWVLGFLGVASIWASKIAGVALSLAALTGAVLLVSKELVMCFLGYVLITLTRPYRIGDFVEIGLNAGRVIDIDAFSTTLAETGSVHQLTGKTLSFPNSVLLSTPVRNISATGRFMVNLFKLTVPFDIDFAKAEECALSAAEAATAEWREAADEHLKRIEASAFLDLPSSRPKVLWESGDSKTHYMTIRFACPVEERVATEQVIFRGFWTAYQAASKSKTQEEGAVPSVWPSLDD